MTFSLNEIEALGKRAARGSGLEWGLAEEAGKALRWLSARGLPGPEALAELLTANDGKAYDELRPVSEDGEWRTKSDRLCPLVAGAALCDRAGDIADGREIVLGPTAQPLLLVPYAAGAARLGGVAVALSWEGVSIVLAGEQMSSDGSLGTLTARNATWIRCRRTTEPASITPDPQPDRVVDAETWSRLSTFAQRTFAPATEASRIAGAGAGLTDND